MLLKYKGCDVLMIELLTTPVNNPCVVCMYVFHLIISQLTIDCYVNQLFSMFLHSILLK